MNDTWSDYLENYEYDDYDYNYDMSEIMDDAEGYIDGAIFSENFNLTDSKYLDPNCTETHWNITLVPRELRSNPTYVMVRL